MAYLAESDDLYLLLSEDIFVSTYLRYCHDTMTCVSANGHTYIHQDEGHRCCKVTHTAQPGPFQMALQLKCLICSLLVFLSEELLLYQTKHFGILLLKSEGWLSFSRSVLMKRNDHVDGVAAVLSVIQMYQNYSGQVSNPARVIKRNDQEGIMFYFKHTESSVFLYVCFEFVLH